MEHELIAAGPLEASVRPQALARCQRVMALAGWEIEYVDMDLTGQRPTAEIKVQRDDGLWLWARVDALGRCTTETYRRERNLCMARNQRGRRPLVPLVEDVFLGRRRHEGPRSMLRNMTNYVTDNALRPVALADLRAAWAGVMSAPVRVLGHNVKVTGAARLYRAASGRLPGVRPAWARCDGVEDPCGSTDMES